MAVSLDASGYFRLKNRRFVPVGANYWPASTGVEMWPRWPASEIQHDLDVMRELGLNCIRFFLRWQDFEPEPGRYDQRMFDRLREMLGWCGQRGIYAHPSLFVGFMSGGVFWPAWRQQRNVFADSFMIERAAAFAQQAAAVIAPFHEHVLAVDQGNELCCLRDSSDAPPASVIHWCQSVNAGIRSSYPQAIIISGNEQNQVVNDTGWRLGAQPGCDLYSMHGYPVPAWHPIEFDGMTDPLCQSLLPLYTKIARAFGPVMLQEFGTIVTFGQKQQDSYLRAMLPAAWEAGANGFLWWCLRDITANVHPYVKNGFEGTLGLIDAQDRVKPGLEFFLEFARSLAERASPTASDDAAVGLYLPHHYYHRDNPLNPGNAPRELSRRLIVANHLLNQLGYRTRIVRGDQPIDAGLRTLLITGAVLTTEEAAALDPWVRSGGRLIWHGPDPVNFGPDYIRLLGALPVDYRAAGQTTTEAFGSTWTLTSHPRNTRLELMPQTAQVLARDERGIPVLLRNSVGQGSVIYATPLVEDTIAECANNPISRDRWYEWVKGMLAGHPACSTGPI